MKIEFQIIRIIPALLWSGIIFFICFLPGSSLPKAEWLDKIHFDKIVHASSYFILFLLLVNIPKKPNGIFILMAGLLCMAQGILIEFLQGSTLVQNRSFDRWDIAANLTGVTIGWLLLRLKGRNHLHRKVR